MVEQAKRVAVLLPSMQVGGAERLVLEELSCLKGDPRFIFEVHLLFEKGPFFDELSATGIPVHIWNAPHKSARMLGVYVNLIRYLRHTRCDILHSHLLDVTGPIAGKLAGTRVVATVHSDRRYSATERFALAKSDLVLGCGKEVFRNISGFIPRKKAGALSNAVRKPANTRFCRKDLLMRFKIKEESKIVVSFGRLTRLKGFDLLIDAFRRVVIAVPEAVLIIGGDGEEMSRLSESVASAGLGESIRLAGLVREVYGVLASCDLYVNSSRWEGLPMTLLEAIAHGKPMVATDVGGNSEVVRDGVTGILVPPEDPERLAGAIIRMLSDNEFRSHAGNEAASLFNREYTIDRHCEALAGYYQQVLQKE
ncbi:MAG: glycosyltransferase [Deltaproteobacteria bacterium]|nr:glycosyltransferase [Deltaproteobacteria bacterium]